MDMENKKGVIYCRVSSIEQVEGTSLESQERMCREFAKRENIDVLDVYVDRGESAKTADRTEFLKAISFCSQKKNKVDYFIVYKIDRFSRNQEDHIGVRAKLKQYGTELRSVTEPIDNSPMGKMMEGILSTFAEFDNNVRTERSVNGMRERIKKGIWCWSAPIGYKRLEKGGNLVIDEDYADFIRMIYEEYAKGTHTYKSLAELINARGFRSKGGTKAIPQLMEKVLKNPLYCGIIRVWDIEARGAFEPLISEKLFIECQSAGRKHRSSSRVQKNPEFPLRKLAVCKFCLSPLTGSHSTGRHGKRYAYYHHHKQNCDYAKFIPKENFEQKFVEFLNEINPSLEYENAFKAIFLDIWKNNNKRIGDHNRRIKAEIEKLDKKKSRVYDLYEEGIYSKEEFTQQRRKVMQQILNKETEVFDTRQEEVNMDDVLEYVFSFVRETSKTWLKLQEDPEKRLRFQNFIFEDNLEFSEEGFGNAKLSPIYSIYQQYLADPSNLVTHISANWNLLLRQIVGRADPKVII